MALGNDSCPLYYAQGFFTSAPTICCKDIRKNVLCATRCAANSIGHTWRMTSTQLPETLVLVHRNSEPATKKRKLRLFPVPGPLVYACLHILGPLSKTESGNQFIVVVTDRYSKLTKAIPTARGKVKEVATIFGDHFELNFGIRKTVLTNNSRQSV